MPTELILNKIGIHLWFLKKSVLKLLDRTVYIRSYLNNQIHVMRLFLPETIHCMYHV